MLGLILTLKISGVGVFVGKGPRRVGLAQRGQARFPDSGAKLNDSCCPHSSASQEGGSMPPTSFSQQQKRGTGRRDSPACPRPSSKLCQAAQAPPAGRRCWFKSGRAGEALQGPEPCKVLRVTRPCCALAPREPGTFSVSASAFMQSHSSALSPRQLGVRGASGAVAALGDLVHC